MICTAIPLRLLRPSYYQRVCQFWSLVFRLAFNFKFCYSMKSTKKKALYILHVFEAIPDVSSKGQQRPVRSKLISSVLTVCLVFVAFSTIPSWRNL